MSDRQGAPLFSLQRRERVMDELRMHGSVSVRDLAEQLAVSELTVRRDINALAEQGLVTRVHGGATLRSSIEPGLRQGMARESGLSRYTLGMVVPSLDYYWPHVINGARAAATQAQSRILLRGSSYDLSDNSKQIHALVDTPGVHGLIVAPDVSDPGAAELLRWLDELPIPVVLAERRAPDASALRLESVATDHAYGAGLAVRHLYAQGHRRIGLLSDPTSPTSVHVRRGWREAVASLGLPQENVVFTDAVGFRLPNREQALDDIVEACARTGTTALIIHSDPEAVAFVQHCVDRGIRVPDDLAVVAYDDEVAHLGEPAISAVRPPKQSVGREAVDLLIARLEAGRRRPVHHVQLNPELVVRDSSVVRTIEEAR